MKLFLSILLLLTGCGHADPTWPAIVRLYPDTSPLLAAATIRSVEDLNTFMGYSVAKFTMDVETLTGYPIVIKYANAGDGRKAGLAVVYEDVCYITVFPVAVTNNLIKTVLWHEIAHCAGLLHVGETGQIMSTSVAAFDSYDENKLTFFKNQLNQTLTKTRK